MLCALGKLFHKCFASVHPGRWHHVANSLNCLSWGGKRADYEKQLLEGNFSVCQ